MHFFRRDTMLQALRFVIQGAGAKVDAAIRKSLVSLLLSMLGHDEVWRGSGRTAEPTAYRLRLFSPRCVGDWVGAPLPLRCSGCEGVRKC